VNWTPRTPSPDEPACWSWPVPPLRDLETVVSARVAEGRSEDTVRMALDDDSAMIRVRFDEFHGRRCAICGASWERGRLVEDHCHRTGQVRGYLCRSDNTREGRSGDLVFVRYRRVHPAAIVDLHEMYSGPGWEEGWSWARDPQTASLGEVRPATPWPAWSPDEMVAGRL
jgi:hypothetical protein